jgi:chitin disaccharide deacetylase
VGITLTGFLNQALLLELLRRVPDGTWELCCHPAYEDAEWRGPRAGSGLRELELFSSPAVRRRVEAMGIELMSYAELGQEKRRAAA